MKGLKAKIVSTYGWRSLSIERELDKIEDQIREEERRLFAPILIQAMLAQLNLPTTKHKVNDNDPRRREYDTQEPGTVSYTEEA